MAMKAGDTFAHPRYIQGSPKAGTARPDICTVTRIARGTVYYKTETGMRMKTTLQALESLLEVGVLQRTTPPLTESRGGSPGQ
jgi:hypothetical protein